MADPINILSFYSGSGMHDEAVCAGLRLLGYVPRILGYVEREASAAAWLLGRMEAQAVESAPVFVGDLADLADGDCDDMRGLVDIFVASPPCQPYSSAGAKRGNADERSFGGAESIIKPAIFALKERIPSMQAGKVTGQEVADAVREIVQRGGGTDEQAAKLATFLRGESPAVDLSPRLPSEFSGVDIRKARQLIEAEEAKGQTVLDQSPLRAKKRQRWLNEMETLPLTNPDNMRDGHGGSVPPGGVRQEKQAFIVIGPPASGKTGAAMRLAEQYGARMIDSDAFKWKMPEMLDGQGLQRVHEESSQLAGAMVGRAMDRGDNLVLATVGSSEQSLLGKAKDLADKGYRTHLILWDLPAEEAARRSVSRFRETGRLVLPEYILNSVADKPLRVYNSIGDSPLFASKSHYANDVPRGQPARVLQAPPRGTGPQPESLLATLDRAGGKGGPVDERSYPPFGGQGAGQAGPDLAPDIDLFGNPITPKVTQRDLFGPEHFEPPVRTRTGDPVPVSDGLRQMVAEVLPTIPGKKRPDAKTVRNALIDRYGSADAQNVVTKTEAPRPPTGREQFLRDMEPIFASQQLSDADKALRREVLSRFSDDAFRGLRIQQGTPEQAEQIIAERAKAGLPPQTPAAAYYDQRAIAANLSAAEQADLDARGLIRLFENSAKHTDFGLVLEEMAHHGYKSILPQADRALIESRATDVVPGD